MQRDAFRVSSRTLRGRAGFAALALVLAACSGGGSDGAGAPSAAGAAGASTGGSAGALGGSGGGAAATSSGGSAGALGGSGGSSGGAAGDASGGSGGMAGSVSATCFPIQEGTSKVRVDGKTRDFLVQLPSDTSKPMALLFLWHGWLQAPADFQKGIVYDVPLGKWVPFDPDAFPMPLMIVTPSDQKLIPPWGLDWDIVTGEKDFAYFQAILQCIEDEYDLDWSRLYSFGFSAGAVFTSLLVSKFPKLFAATVHESGMWLNDPPEQSDITGGFIMSWKWPALDPADRGSALLTHGGDGSRGPKDFATVADLFSANQKALPFLHTNGRTVLECEHGFGHTLDPDLTQAMYYEYLWAHRAGGPPLTAMPSDFPRAPDHVVGSTFCTFHPAP
ncbi:MAG: hypothetical protein OZ921_03200 [Sorangiineae bacterium]|nr:hypothetical protein [Polyangiaceae bacterium]MEB2321495.1 hypothetical protein [Sorangiineae bacterium]